MDARLLLKLRAILTLWVLYLPATSPVGKDSTWLGLPCADLKPPHEDSCTSIDPVRALCVSWDSIVLHSRLYLKNSSFSGLARGKESSLPGLVLHWTNSTMAQKTICQTFGVTQGVISYRLEIGMATLFSQNTSNPWEMRDSLGQPA